MPPPRAALHPPDAPDGPAGVQAEDPARHRDRRDAPTLRDGFIGKVLLWVIGIPLLILVFALAAISRGLFHAGSGSGYDAPDGAKGSPTPPAINQPHGPEQRDRPHRGIDL